MMPGRYRPRSPSAVNGDETGKLREMLVGPAFSAYFSQVAAPLRVADLELYLKSEGLPEFRVPPE